MYFIPLVDHVVFQKPTCVSARFPRDGIFLTWISESERGVQGGCVRTEEVVVFVRYFAPESVVSGGCRTHTARRGSS